MQRRKAELGLRFDPYQAQDVETVGRIDSVIQKGRLPRPCLAPQHQDSAHSVLSRCQDMIDLGALSQAVEKHNSGLLCICPAGA
jgi:hypothetical protein